MRYHSLDHFLRVHHDDLVAIMEAAQTATGGAYARAAGADLHAAAVQEAERATAALLADQLDPVSLQQSTRALTASGADAAELLRFANEISTRLQAWADNALAEDPPLRAQLQHRVARLLARYRTSVTAVQVDDVLARLPGVPGTPRPDR